MKVLFTFFISSILLWSCSSMKNECDVTPSKSDLIFDKLATSWDEGIPLGNATVGALVWQKDSMLRLSLDRTDLWDLRPSDSLSGENFRFDWVKEHIRSKNYRPVQEKFDSPYEAAVAPSKIPGGAIEFPINELGEPKEVHLYIKNALCDVKWSDGTELQTFVHATEPIGWFMFKNLKNPMKPSIVPPVYNSETISTGEDSHAGQNLERLGYEQGTITEDNNSIVYHQKGYGNFSYDIAVKWVQDGDRIYGIWSVTSSLSEDKAVEKIAEAIGRGLDMDYLSHMTFWNNYWDASSISIPDPILQRQYDNEMYKYGSATRANSSPISLQAVWTADNGMLPPWKGDYHHDLNTQLSYWPTYTGNHLEEGLGYLNTLWKQRDTYKKFTKQYFGTEGMNIPGVATLTGEPMGGWAQYSLSQTTVAWLAQHFYLHWKYSADKNFLKNRAYPFLKDAATYMEQISQVNDKVVRTLEFSSSPEVNDNSLEAWFPTMTNYDLGLMKFLFKASAELAQELNLTEEAGHWNEIYAQLPDFDLDADSALTFAKGHPYEASHRHFSHALAFHPLSLIDYSNGEKDQTIINATIKKLDEFGPDWWCGYSYSWLGNMKARAFDGEGAAEALRTFAECFCLKNTFHVNGDQTKSGKSKFQYKPFTLEGNFAFASGIQEMLLQSHTGVVHVFPAIPDSWKNVSFNKLRAMGGFLVSAKRENGELSSLKVYSENGGKITLAIPETITAEIPAGKWINIK